MMTNWKNTRICALRRMAGRIVGLFVVASMLAACDSAGISGDEEAGSLDDTIAFLVSDLGLTTAETAALEDSFAKFDGDREPGFLWHVAEQMQASLTDEQKARLFERIRSSDQRMRDAQRQRRGQQMRPGAQGRRTGGGLAQLSLSDDQMAQIEAIHESFRTKIEAIRAQSDALSREEMKDLLTGIRDAVKAEVEAVLTDDQRAQLAEQKAAAEARRVEHEAQMEANREAARLVMIEVLGLTDAQLTALDELKASSEVSRQSLQDLIGSGADRTAVMEAADALREAHEEAVAAILDETQLEIMLIHNALATRMKNHRKGQGGARRGGAPNGDHFGGNGAGFGGSFGTGGFGSVG